MIPVFRPFYDEREVEAAAEVIRTGWTGLGPKTEQFEKEFAEKYSKGKFVVGLNSCTAALDMALKLIGVNHGDEVIVPTITFVSTAHVVKYNLAEPIFCDVDPITLNMDIQDAVSRITPRTKAIIPVHYSGRPVNVNMLETAISERCADLGINPGKIKIIEDCAHAAGAYYKGSSLPISSDSIGCFSFHAVKNLSMGEGGALVVRDKELADKAKKLRWLGIDKGTWERTDSNKSYWWEYSVDSIGEKSHMCDINAAIGLVQLDKLKESNRLRRERVGWYHKELLDLSLPDKQSKIPTKIFLPPLGDKLNLPLEQSSWHLFCIKCYNRDGLAVFLKENGIMSSVHYKPLHLYSVYGNRPVLPVAEGLFPHILTLPLYPGLTREDVEFICSKIHEFYEGNL
jgi:perosamine synthetase